MEIIAEAGTAHGGDLGKARDLIFAAKEAGADTVKFQAVVAHEILHPQVGKVRLHGQERCLFEEFASLERPPGFYEALMRLTQEAGLSFLCSAFGLGSARMLLQLGIQRLKVASPELNHVQLLGEISSYGLPLLLSTGVARLGDVEEALEITGRENTTLLHCVTAYPAPPEDYRLSLLPALSQVFGVPFGVSDHSMDPYAVPLTSVLAEATVLEKHLTLSRKDHGLDDPVALDPEDFGRMVCAVRELETLERNQRRGFLRSRYGDSLESVWGVGPRLLAPSEKENYGRTNRSIHAAAYLSKGTVLGPESVVVVRTEKNLKPGLHPRFLGRILGARLSRSVEAGEGIDWEDFLSYGEP